MDEGRTKFDFDQVDMSEDRCRSQATELAGLLVAGGPVSERSAILPFFAARPDLSAFLGLYGTHLVRPDLVRHEYDLFGDFVCDLVVGDSRSRAYTFVEFEAATTTGVFGHDAGRATPEWSRQFERGFSQLVDWFWKLDDLRATTDFADRFGSRPIRAAGVLVTGRRRVLREREVRRLQWRTDKVLVDSHQIVQITYDDLLDDLQFRFGL